MTVSAPPRHRRRHGSAPSGTATETQDPPDGITTALPRSHGGERRTRRADRRRERRRRAIGLIVAATCLLAVLVGGATTLRLLTRSSPPEDGGDQPAATAVPLPAAAPQPVRALVVQTTGGALQAVTALVVGPSGQGGDVLFLPAGTMVELPALGLNALREAYVFGGIGLLQSSVENLLGVSFGVVGQVDGAVLAQAVAPAGPLTVDVPDAVTAVGSDGRVQVVFASGPVSVTPERVGDLLAAPGEGTDLDRLVRHQAFWGAWLAAVAARPEAAPSATAGLSGAEAAVVALAGGPVRYRVLPVQAISTGRGADQDLFSVEDDLLDGLRAELDPGATGTPRIRVQVLNGTGAVSVSGLVQPLLVPAGARVELSGNADSFGYAVTQIVFYDDDSLEAARTVQAALGVGEVVRSQLNLGVVDVTVVVGADFLAAAGSGSP